MRNACLLLLVLSLALASPAGAAGELVEDVDYAGSANPEQTLDLFLPDADDPPLLVFVHSRFWSQVDKARDIGHSFARPLQRAGAAVAIVRHRLAPDAPHPAGAEDVATAIAFLIDAAGRHGYDREKLFLAGHGSGGHLAALVTYDPRYLAAHGYTARGIRGLAVWSGSFDLVDGEGADALGDVYQRVFGDAAARRDASPSAHATGEAPTTLLLSAQQDLPGATEEASAFAEALREAGHEAAEAFVLAGATHWSALRLTDPKAQAREYVLGLLGLPGAPRSLEETFDTRRFWRDPAFSTLPFWRDEAHVVGRETDDRFLHSLNLLFTRPGRPSLLQPREFHALDLFAYLARHVPGGSGAWKYLTVTNVRGEQVVWRRDEIEALEPVVVVGLDDERQLFKLADFYHTRKRYTWKGDEEVWTMARPLGAFIHFLQPAPPEVDPGSFGRFALQADAFEVSDTDPLAPLRTLADAEEEILTRSLRCVSCHSFRGAGAKAGHLRARDGQLVGGLALALEDYPSAVWRRYCFEQVAVAAEIGANAVPLGSRAPLLFEMVERERRR